jgi:SEC-C motif-containing protein
LHEGAPARDAEALMRSRYVAYALGLEPYLLATWWPDTRPSGLDLNSEPESKWLGLEIRRHELRGPASAMVEFVARYKIGGRAHRLHEVSRFILHEDRWYYVDGEFRGA